MSRKAPAPAPAPSANESSELGASVVLEEEIDKDYDPNDNEVTEYAEWLGMDLESDKDLLWIAKAGLKAPLPSPWKPCQTGEDGEVFYFNFETGESVWDHPCDEYHRRLYQKERAKKYGLPCEDDSVEEVGRSLGLSSAKSRDGPDDDPGDSFADSSNPGLGGSASAVSMSGTLSDSGDRSRKKKKDKKEKKSKKEKDNEEPKLEAPKTLAPLSARGPAGKVAEPENSSDLGQPSNAGRERRISVEVESSAAPSVGSKSAATDEAADLDEVQDDLESDPEEMQALPQPTAAAPQPPAPGMPPPPSLGIQPPSPSTATGMPAPPMEEPPTVSAPEEKIVKEASNGGSILKKGMEFVHRAVLSEDKQLEESSSAETARLEEDRKKNLAALQAEHKTKLAKHRRELQDEFDLERDKCFGELQDKHDKQIRDEKQRLQQDLAAKKGKLKEEIETQAQNQEELEKQLADSKAELTRIKAESAAFSRRCTEASETTEKLKEEMNQFKTEAVDLKDQHAKELDALKAQLGSKTQEVDRVKADAASASERLVQWEKEMLSLKELASSDSSTKAELAQLRSQLAAKTEQYDLLEKASCKDASEEVKRVGAQLADKTEEASKFGLESSAAQEKLKESQAALQAEKEAKEGIQRKLTQAEDDLGKASGKDSQMLELRKELDARTAECGSLRLAAASSTDSASEELRKLRGDLEEERRSSVASASNTSRELANLKAELDASAGESQRLRANLAEEVARADEQLVALKAQLTEERSSGTSTKSEAATASRELAILKAELNGRVKELERAQARASEVARLASEAERRLQGQVTEERALGTTSQAQLATLQRELAVLQADLEARDGECRRLQEKLAGSSEASLEEVRRSQASLEQERLALSKVKAEASVAARESASLRADLDARTSECGRLRTEAASAVSLAAAAPLEEIRKLQAHVEEERIQSSRAKNEASLAERELASLKAELETWRDQCTRLKAEASGDEVRRLQAMLEDDRAAASRAKTEVEHSMLKATAEAKALAAEVETRSLECGRLRAELLTNNSGGAAAAMSEGEVRELVTLRAQVLSYRAEVEALRQQAEKPYSGISADEERSLRAMIKDRDDALLRLRSDAAQCSAAHAREIEELRSKIEEARQEERLRRAGSEGAVVNDLKAQLRSRASDAEQLHCEVRAGAAELERIRTEGRNAEARSAYREAAAVEAAKASVTEHWKREMERVEATLQSKSADAAAAREQGERAARDVRRLEQEEHRVAKRLEAVQVEADQAQQTTHQVREEVLDAERRLEDARSSMRSERAARTQAESQVRESHRELKVLRSHMQEHAGEAEVTSAEARRHRNELAEKEMEATRLQEQIRFLEAELRQLRSQSESQARQADNLVRRRLAEMHDRERSMDDDELMGHRRKETQQLGITGLKTAVELSALNPDIAEEMTMPPNACAPSAAGTPSRTREHKTRISTELAAASAEAEAEAHGRGVADVAAWSDEGADMFGDHDAGLPLPGKKAQRSSMAGIGVHGDADGNWDAHPAPEALAGLDMRRRELRRERTTLEELRRQWKSDSHRLRSLGGGAAAQALLQDVRAVLDERAAALNRSIDELRAFERNFAQKPGDRDAIARVDGRISTPRPSSATGGAWTARPSEELELIRRWQHIMGQEAPGAATSAPLRSARGSPSPGAGDRLRSHSPLSSRRSKTSREAVDHHLNWLYNFSREAADRRGPRRDSERFAPSGRLVIPY